MKHYLRRRYDIRTNQNDGNPWTSQVNPQEDCVEGCKSLHFNNQCKRAEKERSSNLSSFQLYKRTENNRGQSVAPRIISDRLHHEPLEIRHKISSQKDSLQIQEQLMSTSENWEHTNISTELKKKHSEIKVSRKISKARKTTLANSTFYSANN